MADGEDDSEVCGHERAGPAPVDHTPRAAASRGNAGRTNPPLEQFVFHLVDQRSGVAPGRSSGRSVPPPATDGAPRSRGDLQRSGLLDHRRRARRARLPAAHLQHSGPWPTIDGISAAARRSTGRRTRGAHHRASSSPGSHFARTPRSLASPDRGRDQDRGRDLRSRTSGAVRESATTRLAACARRLTPGAARRRVRPGAGRPLVLDSRIAGPSESKLRLGGLPRRSAELSGSPGCVFLYRPPSREVRPRRAGARLRHGPRIRLRRPQAVVSE